MSDLSEYANLINKQTQLNNSWSAEQAQKQMEFQKEMSSTAHQREVADLKAAGLNPVLSAGGQGASSPSGAMGSTDTSAVPALTEIAVQLAQAESAKAIAEMKSASGYGANNQYYSRSTGWKIVEDIIEGVTGTSAQDAARNFGSYLKSSGTLQKVGTALKNVGTSVYNLVSGNSSKNYVTPGSKDYKIINSILKYIPGARQIQ